MKSFLQDKGIWPVRNLEFWAMVVILAVIVALVVASVLAVKHLRQADDVNVAHTIATPCRRFQGISDPCRVLQILSPCGSDPRKSAKSAASFCS